MTKSIPILITLIILSPPVLAEEAKPKSNPIKTIARRTIFPVRHPLKFGLNLTYPIRHPLKTGIWCEKSGFNGLLGAAGGVAQVATPFSVGVFK